mmetsp:Transcript_738/g.1079  ORF Transcript_738/g.1079 Transcript_738/m.1079 type:complete len:329 (+) Transcript_738:64-1050(+)
MATSEKASDGKINAENMAKYETEAGLNATARLLRRRKGGLRNRQGIELEKRVEYFKGEKLVKYLMENKVKGYPPISSRAEAMFVAKELLRHEFFHRSVETAVKGVLEVSRDHSFDPAGYYTWIFMGSQTLSHFMTTLIIVGFLVVTCFPIWPQFLKIWMWYLSVTLLVFMVGFLTFRSFVWLGMWVLGYEFWILPRLFDESLGFCDSFIPGYSFEKASPNQGYYRISVFVAFLGFLYWAWTQPTDFDSFITAQKDFVSDLYEGNLLSDVSQDAKENIDKPKVQSLEDILAQLEEEEAGEEDSDSIIDQLLEEEDDDDDTEPQRKETIE